MTEFAQDLMQYINKEFKEEVAHMIYDGSPSDVEIFIPTGSTVLDYIISNQRNGGIPVGKVSEIAGLEGTGKSLLAYQILANTQKLGGAAVFIDPENAFNGDFAARVGLNTKKDFVYGTPGSCEDVFKYIFKIIHYLDAKEKVKSKDEKKTNFVTIVWDSVAATPCQLDLDAENPDPTSTVGLKPRVISKNISTLLRMTGRKNLALVFLNQLRMNIKALSMQDKWVTPGGKAIPFASSVRVRLHNAGKLQGGEDYVGIKVKAKCVKTRFGPPYRDAYFPLYFTHGVDDTESVIDVLVDKRKLQKGHGPKYWFTGEGGSDTGIKKVEFKKQIKTDPALNKKVYDLLEDVMVRPMIDPAMLDLQVVDEDGKTVEDPEVI